jgi:ketosteroid isomerase-like protein
MEEVAEAFCRHRFEETLPHLSEDVRWSLVGGDTLTGKAAVAAACNSTASHLTDVTTTFTHFRSIVGPNCVVIDSVGEYTEPSGSRSVVASCDIFDFDEGSVTAIRSYTVEVT